MVCVLYHLVCVCVCVSGGGGAEFRLYNVRGVLNAPSFRFLSFLRTFTETACFTTKLGTLVVSNGQNACFSGCYIKSWPKPSTPVAMAPMLDNGSGHWTTFRDSVFSYV